MLNLHAFIKKRLAAKILLALTIGVAIVMAVIISISISNQREQIRERMITFGRELKILAYASIKHPMSIGDSASVEKQLLDIRDDLHGTEIMICDFNQRIVFSTHETHINRPVAEFVKSEKVLNALNTLFVEAETGHESYLEEEIGGEKYLVTIHSITNTPECHHCHGATRLVLGGLLTKQATGSTYDAIASLRNRTLIISVIGIGALISIIYILLVRLVTRPVDTLAKKAQTIALGNLEVSVPVVTEDSIGVLGHSFNSMVRSIKDQIELANSLRDTIIDPLFMVDPDMVITYMNDACVKLTGFSKEETEGKLTCRQVFQSDV